MDVLPMHKLKMKENELRTLIRGVLCEFIDPGTILSTIVGPEIFAGIGPNMGGMGLTKEVDEDIDEELDEVQSIIDEAGARSVAAAMKSTFLPTAFLASPLRMESDEEEEEEEGDLDESGFKPDPGGSYVKIQTTGYSGFGTSEPPPPPP